ncbi:hypothetical protein [Brevundimonas sp.]|uniref:hypothetical protein n=1 Tax=Brevundimonas sp. TaxID=1871086 RepID=UPI00286D3391|nr:hypothetical protein [Brevundimonas sp.]
MFGTPRDTSACPRPDDIVSTLAARPTGSPRWMSGGKDNDRIEPVSNLDAEAAFTVSPEETRTTQE